MLENPTPLRKGRSGPCIRRANYCEEDDFAKTRRKEVGLSSRAGLGLANITPGPELLTDEGVDFSQPQENGTERLLRLMRWKKMRGDDVIPEAMDRDVRGVTLTPPTSQGARKPEPRRKRHTIKRPTTTARTGGYVKHIGRFGGLTAASARIASKRRSEDDMASPLSKGAVPKAKPATDHGSWVWQPPRPNEGGGPPVGGRGVR